MILSVQKRFSKGVSAIANYTWSHCIGDLSIGDSTGNAGAGLAIPNNRAYDRSNCQSNEIGGTFSSDRRQIFNLTVVYQAPKLANAWANRLLSDWKVSGIYQLLVGLLGYAHPLHRYRLERRFRYRAAGSDTARSAVRQPRPSCWINPKAFTTPAPGTLSGLNRDNIPGPSFFQLDMALSREFPIREGYRFEIRAEAFNITNSFRAGVSLPSNLAGASGLQLTYGTPTFGQITSALDPRIVQLAMKFSF